MNLVYISNPNAECLTYISQHYHPFKFNNFFQFNAPFLQIPDISPGIPAQHPPLEMNKFIMVWGNVSTAPPPVQELPFSTFYNSNMYLPKNYHLNVVYIV